MKRPQRNLFVILSALAVLWLVLIRVPALAALWLLVALFVFWLGLSLYARDLFIGRYRSNRRRWREAIESYERALEIHPHFECLREAIPELRARLRDQED